MTKIARSGARSGSIGQRHGSPDPYPYQNVAHPDPGSGAFFDPGMGKKSGSGSRMNNLDHISESLETIFWG